MSSRRRKRKFKNRHLGNEDMVLQITSMADIFTIILVFLLKSFATGASPVSPSHDMALPESVSSDTMAEAMKIEVSADAVIFEEKTIAPLKNFRFDAAELENDGTARALNIAMRRPASAPALAIPEGSAGPGLLVMADKKVPYTTLKTIMDTAAGNGFATFKLVVVEDDK
jgi:biopolymer transport protein ExbD